MTGISSPRGPLSGGQIVTLYGFGLGKTSRILFGYLPAPSFTVRGGSEIDVVVPGSPNPGTVDIILTIDNIIGSRSLNGAFTYDASLPATVDRPALETPSPVESIPDARAATASADFVTFKASSSALTKTTRTKLVGLAKEFAGTDSRAVIIGYADADKSKKSVRLAEKRAITLLDYLIQAGFEGAIDTVVESGDSKLQRRGAIVYIQPEQTANDSRAQTSQDLGSSPRVTSLIVRLKKGRSIEVAGDIRGTDKLPEPLRDSLTFGAKLGLRMYRIDFVEPIGENQAQTIANRLAKDRGIAFAELDSLVSTQVKIQ